MRFFRALVTTCIFVVGGVLFGASPASAAPPITVCAGGTCSFTTITDAVAAASPGDTIQIAPGTYHENSILVDKPLNIIGAGVGMTIVDGDNGVTYARAGVFSIRVPAAGPEAISISGLTIINAGRTGTATQKFAISVSSPQAATTVAAVTFDDIRIIGVGNRDFGIYATGGQISNANPVPRQVPRLTVSNSTISGTNYNGIGADTWNGDLLINNNALSESTTSSSAILIMNEYTVGRMTAANVIRDNTSTGRLLSLRNDVGPTYGGYDSLTVTDNTITGLAGVDFGIQVGANATSNAVSTRIGTATIMGNTITGDGVSLSTRGVYIRGLVENAVVNENNITGVGTGVGVNLDGGQSPIAVKVNRNRVFANNIGVANATTAAVDANDNWWGCIAGPASVSGYCSTVSNTVVGGTVMAARWISALASADSTVLVAGTSTTVTGQFGALNTGAAIALPAFFAGLDVAFSPDTGSVVPSSGVLDSALAASTTYTAPAVGPDQVRVAIDRSDFAGAPAAGLNLHYGSAVVLGEPIPIDFTIIPAVAPVITSGTPSAPQVGSVYSFQVTATGVPAPTFAVTSGTLPTGLTMDSAGLITGTPNATGAFTFTVTASNGIDPDATATYTLNVVSAGLASTGTNSATSLALGGILVLIIGAGFTFVSRSQRLRK